MENEAQTFIGPERNSNMSKVRRYRSDLAALKREVQRSSKAVPASEEEVEVELFGARGSGFGNSWEAASTSDTLNNSTAMLEDSRRVIAETEEVEATQSTFSFLLFSYLMFTLCVILDQILDLLSQIGDAVASDLESQRNQLLNAHGKTLEIRAYMKDAKQILKNMTWRDLQQKCVLLAIICVLILAIVLVIYYRFVKSDSKDSSSKSTSSTDDGYSHDDRHSVDYDDGAANDNDGY